MNTEETTLQTEIETAIADRLEGDSDVSRSFNTIEEYRTVTGMRFRMTKEEKASGISREEAFTQRFLQ